MTVHMPVIWPQTAHDSQFHPFQVQIKHVTLMSGKSTATCAIKWHEGRQIMLVLHLVMQ